MRLRVRFGYPMKMKATGGALFHDMICSEIDKVGEATRKPLSDCLSDVIRKFREHNAIAWVSLPEHRGK